MYKSWYWHRKSGHTHTRHQLMWSNLTKSSTWDVIRPNSVLKLNGYYSSVILDIIVDYYSLWPHNNQDKSIKKHKLTISTECQKRFYRNDYTKELHLMHGLSSQEKNQKRGKNLLHIFCWLRLFLSKLSEAKSQTGLCCM